MSERAGRARALPADVTHITSLLPHLDEQTVRRALTLHGNREAAIDALLTSPSAALPRAPPPKKRAHAGGGGAAKKRPVVAPPPKVVEPPKVAPPPKVDQPPSSDDDAALGSDDGEAYVLEATVAAAPMHAGGLPPPTDAPDADDASPAAAWVVADAEMADAEGGAPSALAAAAQAACLALAAAAASSSGGGDSDEAEGVTLYRSHHNITGYVAHISAQFGAIRRNSPTAHPPPIQVQGSRPARPALHRVVQRQVPRHLPDGN